TCPESRSCSRHVRRGGQSAIVQWGSAPSIAAGPATLFAEAGPVRILILHSRYRSGVPSGENRVVEDEVHLLREGGHDVGLWDPSPSVRGLGLVRAGVDAVWSTAGIAEVHRRLRATRPDVVHCHNLFPTLS